MRTPSAATTAAPDRATRERVARLLLEVGPQTAAALAQQLGLSAAAVRRHLDGLLERELIREVVPRAVPGRGRGRPARVYALTDTGRADFPHAYDDLASTALRYLRTTGGAGALESFAGFRTGELEGRLRRSMAEAPAVAAIDGRTDDDPSSPARLAAALTAEGYAASANRTPNGVQLCQHHCPVAHVAAEFGQLCEAETRMFERLLGTHVQRLATIAHGDGVCTTFVPDPTSGSHQAARPGGTS